MPELPHAISSNIWATNLLVTRMMQTPVAAVPEPLAATARTPAGERHTLPFTQVAFEAHHQIAFAVALQGNESKGIS